MVGENLIRELVRQARDLPFGRDSGGWIAIRIPNVSGRDLSLYIKQASERGFLKALDVTSMDSPHDEWKVLDVTAAGLESLISLDAIPQPTSPAKSSKATMAKSRPTKRKDASSVRNVVRAVSVFYSYCHADEGLRDKLAAHLSPLNREGIIREWHDRKIGAGKELDTAIDENLEGADVILLLVTPDFIASDCCYGKEIKRAMERHEKGEARVIPVIMRPVDWCGMPFSKLLALPSDGKAVTSWENQDDAFVSISKELRRVAQELITGLQSKMDSTGQGISFELSEAYFTRDYNGVVVLGEIHNRSPLSDQLVNWLLKVSQVDPAIFGEPGRSSFLPGAPWWGQVPFDLVQQKMSRGAVFFPGPLIWRSAPPPEPILANLTMKFFHYQDIVMDLGIFSLSTLRGGKQSSARSSK